MEQLLIYTHKVSPRLTYITRQVFTRILGIDIRLSTTVEDFIAHKGPKLTYSRQPLQNEFFIRSQELLFEQGLGEVEIQMGTWDDLPCFFKAGERSTLPFDILAASFYLISRYEEYLPHVKDKHGRFPPRESLAYQENFLHLPLIDLWAYKLRDALLERFPQMHYRERAYRFRPIIDVTTSHCFARRGLARSIGGMMYDLSKFRIRRLFQRIRVWFNPSADPYDNFDQLIALHKKYPVKAMFFFQFAAYSTYDKNVSPNNNKFRHLIKSVADYSIVSLAISYTASRDAVVMRKEKTRLSEVLNRPVKYSRIRYNRVLVPHTYRDLAEAEFAEDYTMGYTHLIGFRASTSIAFPFYDISLESQQPIRIFPFAFQDYALLRYPSREEMMEAIGGVYQSVKKVNGDMTFIFSNELLGGHETENWLELYESILRTYYA
ncbi:hypothetical protein SAMN04490243_2784 [Robiginitalea myxolifaciens]|uniref:DUF7033 domain-containing protein n=1 Tax=Robiginitalea myxolifaciens TaxID=400055 RepID=A0A1I6HI75_9FLAO|nr:polysaccharide deacetylase family protein [Robiginitalea myxolifaciens]SFR54212.1 hypothetical protein SAMN04490243_2784 [Robiginitalea myxolifaciens]